jgi:hypothetical protein
MRYSLKKYGFYLATFLLLIWVVAPLESCKNNPGQQRYKGKMKPGKSNCPVKDC